MSLNVSATSGNSNYALVPEGQYIARCFKIIDLGTQWVEWQGNKKEQKKVLIMWELLDDEVKMDDGKPYAITTRYTASLDERARLRQDLEAWRGKKFTDSELESFDLKNVLGAYCQLQVVHSEDGKYANVNSIMGLKGTKPKGVNPLVSFDVDEPDMEVFETFSDNLKKIIEDSPEFRLATQKDEPENVQSGKEKAKAVADKLRGDDEEVYDNIEEEPINLEDIPF